MLKRYEKVLSHEQKRLDLEDVIGGPQVDARGATAGAGASTMGGVEFAAPTVPSERAANMQAFFSAQTPQSPVKSVRAQRAMAKFKKRKQGKFSVEEEKEERAKRRRLSAAQRKTNGIKNQSKKGGGATAKRRQMKTKNGDDDDESTTTETSSESSDEDFDESGSKGGGARKEKTRDVARKSNDANESASNALRKNVSPQQSRATVTRRSTRKRAAARQ